MNHSPTTFTVRQDNPSRTLGELVQALTEELENGKKDLNNLYNIMMSYNYELNEWKRFEYWDENKRYTRNLIASDDKHFTLMLLCWNCNKASPIHNHNGSECFLRVLQGDVIEYKYCVDYTNSTNNTNHTNHNNTISQGSSTSNCSHSSTHTTSSPSPTSLVDLQLLSQEVYNTGQCTFINDSIGVHKIETDGNKAVSLHCYIPGYMKCKSYVEELHCMKECHISFDTEHGEIISAHQC